MSSVELQTVSLPSHFAQVQLAGLKDVVDHHLANGHRVQFDAVDVERIDGAAVQFLLAFAKLQSDDKSDEVIVMNASSVLQNALDDMGVTDHVSTVAAVEDDNVDDSNAE